MAVICRYGVRGGSVPELVIVGVDVDKRLLDVVIDGVDEVRAVTLALRVAG